MKTSNKLLIGLIAFIFLVATLWFGIMEYYQTPVDNLYEKSGSSRFDQPELENVSLVFFPSGLLIPVLK